MKQFLMAIAIPISLFAYGHSVVKVNRDQPSTITYEPAPECCPQCGADAQFTDGTCFKHAG